MNGLLWGRMVHLKKNYKMYALMFVLPIIFFLAFGMGSSEVRLLIILADEDQSPFSNRIVEELSQSPYYSVYQTNRETLYKMVSEGTAEVGLVIEATNAVENDIPLKLFSIKNSVAIASFEGTLQTIVQKLHYEEKLTTEIATTISSLNPDVELFQLSTRLRHIVSEKFQQQLPVRTIDHTNVRSNSTYDHQLQTMLGFILFFSIYTTMFSIGEIINDKKYRVWDRFIISPMTKRQLYLGNMVFSFSISFLQIVVLILVSKFLLGVNWGDNIALIFVIILMYIFSIMAFGMFLVSISKTTQQFNSIVPIFSVAFAMLGGAFWPSEIVTSEVITFVAKFVPVTYAMNSIKQLIWNQASWDVVASSVMILGLIGCFFIGIGMLVIEKRAS